MELPRLAHRLWRFRGAWVLMALPVLLASCSGGCEDEAPPVRGGPCQAPLLRDSEGGAIVLRGINVSGESKWTPDHFPPFDAIDYARVRDELGINALRILVFWEAIEPYPGIYDRAYLDALHRLTELAASLDLYVVIDMHQDVYGRGFGHAGAPRWACDESVYATYEQREPWFMNYLEPEVLICFDRLYQHRETRAAFVGAWAEVVLAVRSSTSVLAYEILNEPFWGSATASIFDQRIAPTFYGTVIDVLRALDDRAIAIQPAPTASVGVPSDLVRPREGPLWYMPHFYPSDVELRQAYNGDAEPIRKLVQTQCTDAHRLDAPLVIGEIGARRNTVGLEEYLRDVYNAFDEAGVGAFYWDLSRGQERSYGVWNEDERPTRQAHAIARPYPKRTAGTPVRWTWDETTGVFEAEWTEDDEVEGETIIALPSLAFPFGLLVSLSPEGPTHLDGGELRIARIGGTRQLTLTRLAAFVEQVPGETQAPATRDGGITAHAP